MVFIHGMQASWGGGWDNLIPWDIYPNWIMFLWPRWPRQECHIFRVSLLIAAKLSCPGERISIKYKMLFTSRANMLSPIWISWLIIFSFCKPSQCIYPWEIRFTPAPCIYWIWFNIKTWSFLSKDLQVIWMSPSPSADILPPRPVIGGWLVKLWNVENSKQSWQVWRELAESQIKTNDIFIEIELDVAIKHPSSEGIIKNETWPEISREANAFVPMFGFWRLHFPAVVILP